MKVKAKKNFFHGATLRKAGEIFEIKDDAGKAIFEFVEKLGGEVKENAVYRENIAPTVQNPIEVAKEIPPREEKVEEPESKTDKADKAEKAEKADKKPHKGK